MNKNFYSFIAIIPARARSKEIKNKNLIKINNRPLIDYTIEAAKKSKYIRKIFVSTNGKNIESYCKKKNISVINRPKNLSGDIIMPDEAVVHAINFINKNFNFVFDNVVFLQPTSPIRKFFDIDRAIEKFKRYNYDSLFSGVNLHPLIWLKKKNKLFPLNYSINNRKRRQNENRETIIENGSFYITKKKIWYKNNNRLGGKIGCYLMNNSSVFEVDSYSDLKLVKKILKSSSKKRASN